MAETTGTVLPPHIDETIQAIAALHAEHRGREGPVQQIVRRSVDFVGRPRFIALLTLLLVGWVAINVVLGNRHAFDPPPYAYLFDLGQALALYIMVLILITQRRDDQLAELRAQLSLDLAILSEQKNAKMIKLLEELRRDLPMVADRIDYEAAALSEPADPQTVLDAIKDSQQGRFDPKAPPP